MSPVRNLPKSRIACSAAIAVLICICASIAPATPRAYAAERIIIDGVAYTEAAIGDGWSWDGSESVELSGFDGEVIMARGSLSVTVSGDNEMNFLGLERPIDDGSSFSGNLELRGEGKLTFGRPLGNKELKSYVPEYAVNPYYNGDTLGGKTMIWDNASIEGPVTVSGKGSFYIGGNIEVSNGATLDIVADDTECAIQCDRFEIDGSTAVISGFGCGMPCIMAYDFVVRNSALTINEPDRDTQWGWPTIEVGTSLEFENSNVSCKLGSMGMLSYGSMTINNSTMLIDAGNCSWNEWKKPYCFAVRVAGDINLQQVQGCSIVEETVQYEGEESVTCNALVGSDGSELFIVITPDEPVDVAHAERDGDMFRLYNPFTGEHFYTASAEECNGVAAAG